MATKTKPRPAALAPLAPGSARIKDSISEQQSRLAIAARSLEAGGVEDIHGARVAARRLRSLLKTFRPLLDERRTRLYREDWRSFARSLGAVREADVRRDLLLGLARAAGSAVGGTVVGGISVGSAGASIGAGGGGAGVAAGTQALRTIAIRRIRLKSRFSCFM